MQSIAFSLLTEQSMILCLMFDSKRDVAELLYETTEVRLITKRNI